MKKRSLLVVLILALVLPIILAADDATSTDSSAIDTTQENVDKAYTCLESQIDEIGCEELSPTQKIFSLMATGKCLNNVLSDSKNNLCWPSDNCDIKTTSQAVLALTRASTSTADAQEWLLAKNDTPEDVDWYLQIESTEESECEIKYSTGGKFSIKVKTDKQLSGSAGSCLTLSSGNWWYKISQSCYDVEFSISCDKAFLTNLLFKEKTSSTIHISEKTSSTSAEGTTREKVDSLCLANSGKCDYEGTLWASIALKTAGKDVTSFMPYLITQAPKNTKLIPESFLYILTGYDEFRTAVLQKQKNGKYWDESGNKFYDTSIALFPFKYLSSTEKTDTISWLMEIQESNGCWDGGNVLSNSFLLFSIWPKQVSSADTREDCEAPIGYCMSEVKCEGEVLENYKCSSGTFKCCDTPEEYSTCREQGGEICTSAQECIGGESVSAADIDSGEECCIDGRCEQQEEQTQCEENGGICEYSSCSSGKKQTNTYSCNSGDVCCVAKSGSSLWWLWVLIILIILIIIAIIFRNKLRPYWINFISKFRKGGTSQMMINRGPRFPPASSSIPLRPLGPRKIIPMQQPRPRAPISKPAQRSDIEDVLKKLREIGK